MGIVNGHFTALMEVTLSENISFTVFSHDNMQWMNELGQIYLYILFE